MTPDPARNVLSEEERHYQREMLSGVSRTFAFTIPTLPDALRDVVGNAYLLCRIADTIEDDSGLSPAQKRAYSAQFAAIVDGTQSPQRFAASLSPLLTDATLDEEHRLVRETALVVDFLRRFTPTQQAALARCVRVMAAGMAEFQLHASLSGLPDLAAFDRYCYHVAGVVGEMLTELFCDHCDEMKAHRERLLDLAVSFGAALQMTNILKDIWDDRRRGACWLPRDLFSASGCEVERLEAERASPGFEAGMTRLLARAHGHLRNSLDYIALIPEHEAGVRRFCLWALGMAVLTLRKISLNPAYRSGSEVKISRRAVRGTVALTNLATRQDGLIRGLFRLAARPLPPAEMPTAAELAICRSSANRGQAVVGAP